MRSIDVEIGGVYEAKVGGRLVPVRLNQPRPDGGWNATNTETGRSVRIATNRRLRRKIRGPEAAQAEAATPAPADPEADAGEALKVAFCAVLDAIRIAGPFRGVGITTQAIYFAACEHHRDRLGGKGDSRLQDVANAAADSLRALFGEPLL